MNPDKCPLKCLCRNIYSSYHPPQPPVARMLTRTCEEELLHDGGAERAERRQLDEQLRQSPRATVVTAAADTAVCRRRLVLTQLVERARLEELHLAAPRRRSVLCHTQTECMLMAYDAPAVKSYSSLLHVHAQ